MLKATNIVSDNRLSLGSPSIVNKLNVILFDLLVFTIPALQFIEVDVIGRLFASDIILLGIFPFLLLIRGKRLCDPLPRTFIQLGMLWLVGQVLTDITRQSPLQDFTRGWAAIGMTLVNFSALYLLIFARPRRIILYAVGVAVGMFLDFYLSPSVFAPWNPWKFGVGGPITLFLVLLATWKFGYRRTMRLCAVAILGFAATLNVCMGFRSMGGICFLTAVYVMIQWLCGRHYRFNAPIRFKSIIGLSVVATVAGWGFIQAYGYAVEQGLLGEQAKFVYEMQAWGKYGLLLGGRSEILASSQAVMDSPILGHGSWAKDPKYVDVLVGLKRKLGYSVMGESETCLIPTHSHIMQAWVWAGILGTVFWVWILFLPTRIFARLYRTPEPLTPLLAFFGFLLIWDILFSPYGSQHRFLTPYYVIVLMSFLPVVRKRNWMWSTARTMNVGTNENLDRYNLL